MSAVQIKTFYAWFDLRLLEIKKQHKKFKKRFILLSKKQRILFQKNDKENRFKKY
jgi:hypothetical protein